MTHSLHREGSLESLEGEYVLFIYPARGFNYKGSAPKIRHMVELLYQAGPVNMIPTSLRRNMYSGVTNEEILDSITVDGTRVYSVFDDREKLKKGCSCSRRRTRGSRSWSAGSSTASGRSQDGQLAVLRCSLFGLAQRLVPDRIEVYNPFMGRKVWYHSHGKF